MLPAILFLSKSEIAIVLGFPAMVSYKSTKTVTFFLILQTLKSKYFPNIDRENFEELLSESEEVRALS